jgi:hypothetical protein
MIGENQEPKMQQQTELYDEWIMRLKKNYPESPEINKIVDYLKQIKELKEGEDESPN